MFARMSPLLIPPVQSRKSVGPNSDASIRGENPGFMQRREDSGCEALIVAGHQHADQGPKRAAAQKDVKYEDRTDYVHENTGTQTIWPIINRAFWPEMHRFCENGPKSIGLLAESVQVMR